MDPKSPKWDLPLKWALQANSSNFSTKKVPKWMTNYIIIPKMGPTSQWLQFFHRESTKIDDTLYNAPFQIRGHDKNMVILLSKFNCLLFPEIRVIQGLPIHHKRYSTVHQSDPLAFGSEPIPFKGLPYLSL
jgi:hypothetical protein